MLGPLGARALAARTCVSAARWFADAISASGHRQRAGLSLRAAAATCTSATSTRSSEGVHIPHAALVQAQGRVAWMQPALRPGRCSSGGLGPLPLPMLARPSLTVARAAATEATKTETAAAEAEAAPEATHTVLFEVGDMKCGACSAAVKRMLLTRPEVASAAVNLMTETAAVQDEARRSVWDLGVAWLLVAACCTHHAGHLLHAAGYHQLAHAPLLTALSDPRVSGALGAFALLGPGRRLLVDGFRALAAGNPNMNSLVGLGSAASFGVGLAGAAASAGLISGPGAAALGALAGDATFLEEPVMLLAFVLLGRALEARAKYAVVPTSSVRAGDILRVLPGEKVPVDGEVLEGEAAADESLLSGESALVAKAPGSRLTGGTVVYEGAMTLRATATGAASTVAGIARLVSDAQAREAPVQRLADAVAGRFCLGVMAAAAATFLFWLGAGAALWPHVLDGLLEALELGGACLAKIRQNLVWALGYNVVGIPLAAAWVWRSTPPPPPA
eukprot:XP_001702593.1 copper-translocating P-type ATPase [Chlamydomonas reinhardtii]